VSMSCCSLLISPRSHTSSSVVDWLSTPCEDATITSSSNQPVIIVICNTHELRGSVIAISTCIISVLV